MFTVYSSCSTTPQQQREFNAFETVELSRAIASWTMIPINEIAAFATLVIRNVQAASKRSRRCVRTSVTARTELWRERSRAQSAKSESVCAHSARIDPGQDAR